MAQLGKAKWEELGVWRSKHGEHIHLMMIDGSSQSGIPQLLTD